jgi:DNA-binding FrmR family transcriptional regulator
MKCDQELTNRIRRMQGQLNGILKMMQNSERCDDLVIQLKAIRANLDKTISILTTSNLKQVLVNQPTNEKNINAALDLIVKSRS